MPEGEILAIDRLERLAHIYNSMGQGSLQLEYQIYEDENRFDVTFRHLSTQKTYNFTFELDTPYNEFIEIVAEAIQGEIRSSTFKGIAG